jgi:hypothetical protein
VGRTDLLRGLGVHIQGNGSARHPAAGHRSLRPLPAAGPVRRRAGGEDAPDRGGVGRASAFPTRSTGATRASSATGATPMPRSTAAAGPADCPPDLRSLLA